MIDIWLNEAVVEFLRRTKCTIRKASMPLTSGEGDYELDDDILAFKDLWVLDADGNQGAPLERFSSDEMEHARGLAGTPDTSTRRFALEGANLLMLYPAPGPNMSLKIKYVPRPTEMSQGTDDPAEIDHGQIPREFHKVLVAYATWKAARFDDDASSQVGRDYEETYEKGIIEARMALARKAGVSYGVANVGRRRNWPHSPGVDWGN